MIPTVGQIVLFSTTLNGEPAARPAIVTRINEDGSVNLVLLHPTDFGISTDLLTDPAAPPAEDQEEEDPDAQTIPYGEKNRCGPDDTDKVYPDDDDNKGDGNLS